MEQAVAETPATPNLTLANAIRAGAKQHPQGFGTLFEEVEDDDDEGATYYATCALGAAYIGAGWKVPAVFDEWDAENEYDRLRERFPELAQKVWFPIKEHVWNMGTPCRAQLSSAIMELNDEFHWTREQIADWVEGLALNG